MVDAADAVVRVDLAQGVDGACVQPVGLLRGVLDLQPRLDVLDGRRDEADGAAGHDARDAVAVRRQRRPHAGSRSGRGLDVEDILREQAAVDVERAQHDRVHEHPADERRRCALVEADEALIADRLREALQRAAEARCVSSLQADLDGIEGVANWTSVLASHSGLVISG